jgi:hypothetical protein
MTQPQYGPNGWPAGAQPAPPQQYAPPQGYPPPPVPPAQQYGPPPQQYAQPQYGPPPQGYATPPAPPRVAGPPPSPDELMAGGHKAAQYPDQAFGTVVGGVITAEPKTTQQIDFDSQKPKFYEDGNPAWQIVCPVQAFPPQPDDDGIRAFYLKGQMKQAATQAVQRAGATRLEQGGQLFMRYVRDEPNSRGRGKPKKIYEGHYVPPVGDDRPVPAPAAQPAAPAPTAYAPPAQPPQHHPGGSGGPTTYAPPPAGGGGNGGPQYAPPPQQAYAPPPAAGYMGAGDVAGVTPPDPWSPDPSTYDTRTIDQPPY